VSITGAAINNKGEVTGTLTSVEGGPLEGGLSDLGGERFGSAFIYAGGTTNLIAFSRFSIANAINRGGQVVGQTTLQALSIPPAQAECDERRWLAALSLMNSGMEADDAFNKTSVAVMCPISRLSDRCVLAFPVKCQEVLSVT
jgi:hypothetical protein